MVTMGDRKKSRSAAGNKRIRRHYPRITAIDGSHPFRTAVPTGHVTYGVRSRPGGKIFYFNFDLAREIGLIPASHPDTLGPELIQAVLDTFGIEIINEYDILNGVPIAPCNIRSNSYMATRYLQLQHPDRGGRTSGDGRSIWNGYCRGRNGTWDISSCGTGATCLSPATAIEGKFHRTGDKRASYGCGRADLWDGVCAALMSEILHRNNINTERTLALIDYGDGTSINVRAYRNLIRPAHFFAPLKQGDRQRLKATVDYYSERQIANGQWPAMKGERRYLHFLRRITEDFARTAAQFESEYIFCWLDWDGDNILSDAAIIDYGSLRQFGLYHHEYRYDDVDRMSTTIREQKNNAKYIVQTCAQLVDFLICGKKRNIKEFRHHPALREFEEIFMRTKDELTLYKIGYDNRSLRTLMNDRKGAKLVREFRAHMTYFEKVKSARGSYEVSDGVTWDAVFCIRDLLRELPKLLLSGAPTFTASQVIEILRSNYATAKDLRITPARKRHVAQFQRRYIDLVDRAALLTSRSRNAVLSQLAARSARINRYDRVTGDAIIHLADQLKEHRYGMNYAAFHRLFNDFVDDQVLRPEYLPRHVRRKGGRAGSSQPRTRAAFDTLADIVRDFREGI